MPVEQPIRENPEPAEECCPRFDPDLWDCKVVEWAGKRFIKDSIYTFFYVPIRFGAVMARLDAKVRAAGASIPYGLALYDHKSKWKMDVYLSVDREVPGAENVAISGKFLFKAYEGDFRETGKWCADFKKYAAEKKYGIEKLYMWYTTCPKCAARYGKNYVAIAGKLA